MFTVHDDPLFLRVVLNGKMNRKALFDAQDALMRHPKYPYKNSLWVVEKGFICGFSNIDLFETAERMKTFLPLEAKKQKCAFFASNGFPYALLQLFCKEAERKGLPFQMMPFMDLQNAEAWLISNGDG